MNRTASKTKRTTRSSTKTTATETSGADWTSIVDVRPAPRRPILRFARQGEQIVVEAQDVGYAIQVWTVLIVDGVRQTRALARFHDPDELTRDVEATRARYLGLGWSEE